ncbi:hypothetical protein JW960_22880 [candidate division KSB1 bacterium]|nr:hypothetical protein [candidate division KSB1 bacterium]
MYILFIILHYVIGILLLLVTGFRKINAVVLGLAFPLGLGTATAVVFLMDVMHIHLNLWSVTGGHIVVVGILYFIAQQKMKLTWSELWRIRSFAISLSEWPFLIVITALVLISAWRCIYVPVTPYDAIQGIDLLAKYAVQEGHINSSMFTDMQPYLSTQPYYAPFCALSQIIYRLGGLPFGKIWLSFMFISFVVVFYCQLRDSLHPILAGILTLTLIAIPEMYAYTFMLQTDYSNAIFVTLGIIILYQYLQEKQQANFRIACLLLGFSVWTRSETIAFILLTAVLLFFYSFKSNMKPVLKDTGLLLIPGFVAFAAWNLFYLPVVLHYSPESYFKFGFWDMTRLGILLKGIWALLSNSFYWGYILHFFIFILAINLLIFRDTRNVFLLFWIIGLIAGFLILLYHLQLGLGANINYTFRRGLFKLFPVVLFYIGTSRVIQYLSEKIQRFESAHITT